jgi:hypothetical protein
MLSFGGHLYETTQRDELTVQLESFAREATGTLNAGTASLSTTVPITIPNDRALFLKFGVARLVDPTAGSRWQNFGLSLVYPPDLTEYRFWWLADSANGLRGDNADTRAQNITVNRTLDFIVPPRCQISIAATRSDPTLAATYNLVLIGWLMPPGTLVRGL